MSEPTKKLVVMITHSTEHELSSVGFTIANGKVDFDFGGSGSEGSEGESSTPELLAAPVVDDDDEVVATPVLDAPVVEEAEVALLDAPVVEDGAELGLQESSGGLVVPSSPELDLVLEKIGCLEGLK